MVSFTPLWPLSPLISSAFTIYVCILFSCPLITVQKKKFCFPEIGLEGLLHEPILWLSMRLKQTKQQHMSLTFLTRPCISWQISLQKESKWSSECVNGTTCDITMATNCCCLLLQDNKESVFHLICVLIPSTLMELISKSIGRIWMKINVF